MKGAFGLLVLLWISRECLSENATLSPTSSPTVVQSNSTSTPSVSPTFRRTYIAAPESDARSWQDAQTACQERFGTNLATITTASENVRARDACQEASSNAECWIGLNDRESERAFAWASGFPSRFRQWNDNEPNQDGPGEDCVAIYQRNGNWNDQDCARALAFVCDATPGPPNPPPTNAPTGPGSPADLPPFVIAILTLAGVFGLAGALLIRRMNKLLPETKADHRRTRVIFDPRAFNPRALIVAFFARKPGPSFSDNDAVYRDYLTAQVVADDGIPIGTVLTSLDSVIPQPDYVHFAQASSYPTIPASTSIAAAVTTPTFRV